jgi:hypothetical protein
MPNRYAYYSAPGVKLEDGKKVIINDKAPTPPTPTPSENNNEQK